MVFVIADKNCWTYTRAHKCLAFQRINISLVNSFSSFSSVWPLAFVVLELVIMDKQFKEIQEEIKKIDIYLDTIHLTYNLKQFAELFKKSVADENRLRWVFFYFLDFFMSQLDWNFIENLNNLFYCCWNSLKIHVGVILSQ